MSKPRKCAYCGEPLTGDEHPVAKTHEGDCRELHRKQLQAAWDKRRNKERSFALRVSDTYAGRMETIFIEHACFSGGDPARTSEYIRAYAECSAPKEKLDRRRKY